MQHSHPKTFVSPPSRMGFSQQGTNAHTHATYPVQQGKQHCSSAKKFCCYGHTGQVKLAALQGFVFFFFRLQNSDFCCFFLASALHVTVFIEKPGLLGKH